jgi:type III secretion protein T
VSDLGIGVGSALFELFDSFQGLLLLVALTSIRIYAAMSVLPATAESVLPGLTRGALACILAAFVSFGQSVPDVLQLGAGALLALSLKELFLGVLIGFSAATVFWVAESVGALVDTQTGYNSVQMSNPMSGEQSTPVSALLLQFCVAIFYLLGGMLVFLGALMESFKVWPLMSALPSMASAAEAFVVQQADTLMTATIKFAAPVLLILLLIDLSVGLITRVADKLEPSSIGQPLKAAVGMIVVALMISVFAAQVRQFLLPTDLMQRLHQVMPGNT